MTIIFYMLLAGAVLALLGLVAMRMPPARLATTLRYFLPGVMGIAGLALTLVGRISLGAPLLFLAFTIFGRMRSAARAKRSAGGRSHVRSAALEMELDLDSGDMNGVVLAGSMEGAELGALDLEALLRLRRELDCDAESLGLLEAYLDRRMPDWRAGADADDSAGLGTSPGSGAMTKQEAYQILGLGPGAGKSDISEAHRRLMKRMHPDTGGSEFLASRINEAKDVLLRRHD
ncbi:DnaJ-like protein [Hoeflea marina]|uniref:DnaJ-like protein n=1 Tax=Hoeflea marina TaxID=274592 RepID=A0A317PRT8_9HYPH|nr:DnaJ-like protein [Hoeflea marina]